MELNQYNYQRERRINFLRAGILLIIGMAILFYIAYAKINNWFGTENDISVYAEVFDIVGWVFIWETVTVAFLTPSELGINSNMFRLRVLNVKFLDIFNQVLVEESLANEASKWESEKKLEKVSRFALLFSGVALIALSIFSITTYINTIIDIPSFYPDDKSGMAIAYIVSITIATIATIIEFLGGFVALSRYAGRRFLPKFGNLFTILISIILILDIIGSVGSLTVIIRSSAVFVITLVYLFGYISNAIITKNKYFFRKEIKKEENTNEIGE